MEDIMSLLYLKSLIAVLYWRAPANDWNWETKTGRTFPYSAFGAACSEVQIDCLTGNHQLLRTDIVMDVGKSLNPAVDIGQVIHNLRRVF